MHVFVIVEAYPGYPDTRQLLCIGCGAVLEGPLEDMELGECDG